MTRLLSVVAFVFVGQYSFGMNETDTSKVERKANYFFHVQSGAMVKFGSVTHRSPVNFTSSTVHGVRIGEKYKVGLGVGLDYYDARRLIPVFVSVSRDLVGKKNKLFMEMNYGGSFAKPLGEEYGLSNSEMGRMINPSLGYSVKSDNLSISFVVGYKFQRIIDHYDYPNFDFTTNSFLPSGENRTSIQMDLSRIIFAIRVGWR